VRTTRRDARIRTGRAVVNVLVRTLALALLVGVFVVNIIRERRQYGRREIESKRPTEARDATGEG
jgi:hypothetical protein